jgi:MoaA/NifB/PqqE/SkfB family radical SAM enzyme
VNLTKRIVKKLNKDFFPEKLFFGPKHIILGVNNVCNLHCKMCDVGTQTLDTNFAQNLLGSKPLNMPLDLFKSIVDQISLYYPSAKLGYAFTEPLVYTHLSESLEYANSKGVFTSLTTNALNLERKAKDLIEGNLKELYISLDGLKEVHNYTRGNNQSFQKAIAGIETLTSLNSKIEISVYCVITEWNYTQLYDFAEYMTQFPLVRIGFMHQSFITHELSDAHNLVYGTKYKATHSNIEDTDIDSIELEKLLDELNKLKKIQNPNITFSPPLDTLQKLTVYYKQASKKIGKTCNDVFSNLMIKTDGSIIPAHGRCYNVSMGNLYQNTLPEIWNSAIYGQFRKDLLKAGGLFTACNRCCSAY